ncbi:hypothetical protein MBGDF03_01087 [Thermoplasmatales archaeon SCGC AB-540-F20]|nr:hypothetical protein MBGDF03_01087 [Thermoplasmatales archaeon SCGC AB-540-F20]
MNWKKWIKKHWWKALIPVTVPVGIIILRHINKNIRGKKKIIEYEKCKRKHYKDVQLLTDEKGETIFMNRCYDCGRSDGPLFWLLTELGGRRFCGDCFEVYYKLVLLTNRSQGL